jgi:hypothetical protein
MNKMMLTHIAIFAVGFGAGYYFAKQSKKSFANVTAKTKGDLRTDWNYCTSKCYSGGATGGYSCLADCMRKRGNPID